MNDLQKQLSAVKQSQIALAGLTWTIRNQILKDLAKMLVSQKKNIIAANQKDLKNLKRLDMRDRLVLNEKRIKNMADGLLDLAKMPDPLNEVLEAKKLKNGLGLKRISVPLGVVGVIYESRPNVTVDLAGLAIKSGNGLVLKGGSEAYYSNAFLVGLIHKVLKKFKLSKGLIYLINPQDEWQKVLMNAHGFVDVIIPRGSNRLIEWVRENSRLPVIETGAGVCHTFVDADYSPKTAANIIVNAKTQRPDVCNALDTLVVHKAALKPVLSLAGKKLSQFNVEIFADKSAYAILKPIYPSELLRTSKPNDYGREFLALKMSIRTVNSFEEGLDFVKKYTSGHSEAILSKNKAHINRFLAEIDAAVVYANASTRFTDGGEFGLGAEVGISTQKLHARGPMGLMSLTSYKWVVSGQGQVRI